MRLNRVAAGPARDIFVALVTGLQSVSAGYNKKAGLTRLFCCPINSWLTGFDAKSGLAQPGNVVRHRFDFTVVELGGHLGHGQVVGAGAFAEGG